MEQDWQEYLAMSKVSRFHVMAVLQAARARALGLDPDEAKSWGLNRALFYAAAKRSWANAKALGLKRPFISEIEKAKQHFDIDYKLGGERSYISRDSHSGLRFKFGDEIQHPSQFDRLVKGRFNNWNAVWAEAVDIIKSTDRKNIQSQSRFYEKVYKPRRDRLAVKWSSLPERARHAA